MQGAGSLVAFTILALFTGLSALGVVTFRNVFHAAISMAFSFVGVAGIYVLLHAEFLAAIQILLYVGAIAVMIVFAVMLTQRGDMALTNLSNNKKWLAGLVSIATLLLIGLVTGRTVWTQSTVAMPESTVPTIGKLFMTDYVLPFEIAAVLLLVAMIGAIVIAKEVKKSQ